MEAQKRKTAKTGKIYLSYLRPQLAQNQLGINWSWVNAGQKFKGNLNYQSEDMSDSVTKDIIFQQHVPFLGTVITEWYSNARNAEGGREKVSFCVGLLWSWKHNLQAKSAQRSLSKCNKWPVQSLASAHTETQGCKELKPVLLKDQSQLSREAFQDQRRDFYFFFLRKKANRE